MSGHVRPAPTTYGGLRNMRGTASDPLRFLVAAYGGYGPSEASSGRQSVAEAAVPFFSMTGSRAFEYDVCLSFAGEQREYVEDVAARLRASGVRVFYDDYEKASLWGKDLYEHLDWIYRK